MTPKPVRDVTLSLLIGLALVGLVGLANPAPSIPRCEEDAVLVGVDNFEDGRYTRYICGPAVDDYKEDR